MNLSNNISIERIDLLNKLYTDKNSLVSKLPKDVVNLVAPYLFKKLPEESQRFRYKIGFCIIGGSEKHSPASQQASIIGELYDSTEIRIEGISLCIRAVDYSHFYRGPIYPKRFFTAESVTIYFLEPTIEFPYEFTSLNDPFGWKNEPIILAWKKMDLNEAQRERLQNLPPNFSVVEYGDNPVYLLLETAKKIIEVSPDMFSRLRNYYAAQSEWLRDQPAPVIRMMPKDDCCTIL